MRWMTVATVTLAHASASYAQAPTLLVMTDDAEVLPQLRFQLPDWTLEQAPSPQGATPRERQVDVEVRAPQTDVLWFEPSDVVLLRRNQRRPQRSPLPARTTPGWARSVALVIEGLLSDSNIVPERAANLDSPSEAAAEPIGVEPIPGERTQVEPIQVEPSSRWTTPLARSGLMFRFGWAATISPRAQGRLGAYENDLSVGHGGGGVRLRAGYWLNRFLRTDVVGHLVYVGAAQSNDHGPEGAIGVQLMVLSSTRLRMGAGIEVSAIAARELDALGGTWGWVGAMIGFPMEIGVEVNRRGGVFFQAEPTVTRTPYSPAALGVLMSLEWEFA
ncbi:MAG: hypothetical protein AAGE52_06265 [Myxococcota bacterium]